MIGKKKRAAFYAFAADRGTQKLPFYNQSLLNASCGFDYNRPRLDAGVVNTPGRETARSTLKGTGRIDLYNIALAPG
jgi:hypothetical protein